MADKYECRLNSEYLETFTQIQKYANTGIIGKKKRSSGDLLVFGLFSRCF